MKKKLFCVCLVLGFFAFALAPLAVQAQEKAMKLRLSVMWPPQHPWTKTFDQWGKDVEKATAWKDNSDCIRGQHAFTAYAGL